MNKLNIFFTLNLCLNIFASDNPSGNLKRRIDEPLKKIDEQLPPCKLDCQLDLATPEEVKARHLLTIKRNLPPHTLVGQQNSQHIDSETPDAETPEEDRNKRIARGTCLDALVALRNDTSAAAAAPAAPQISAVNLEHLQVSPLRIGGRSVLAILVPEARAVFNNSAASIGQAPTTQSLRFEEQLYRAQQSGTGAAPLTFRALAVAPAGDQLKESIAALSVRNKVEDPFAESSDT